MSKVQWLGSSEVPSNSSLHTSWPPAWFKETSQIPIAKSAKVVAALIGVSFLILPRLSIYGNQLITPSEGPPSLGLHKRSVYLRGHGARGKIHSVLEEITFPIGRVPGREQAHLLALDPKRGAISEGL